MDEIEYRRALPGEKVVRLSVATQTAREKDGEKRIEGIGAPYNSWTTLYKSKWMEIREQYAPGCFTESLRSDEDVKSCRNHIRHDILGRLSNKTLKLNDKDDGLFYDVRLNNEDPEAMRIHAQVKRGDIIGASTVFRIMEDGIDTEEKKVNGRWLFLDTIKRAHLYEVGPVTDPAYLDTTAQTHMRMLVDDEFARFMAELEGQKRSEDDELSRFFAELDGME